MQFEKKILVLKQIEEGYATLNKRVSGIARLECENNVITLFLSIINLKMAESGQYYFFILDKNKKLFEIELGQRPLSIIKTLYGSPNLSNFCAGICFIDDGIPEVVAYAEGDKCLFSFSQFKKAVIDRQIEINKNKKKEQEQQTIINANTLSENNLVEQNCEENKATDIIYNDEAVATENYFSTEEQIKEKLQLIDGWENDKLSTENELPFIREQEKANEIEKNFTSLKNEANDSCSQEFTQENPYFLTVKKELEEIFDKFSSVEELEKMFLESKFAKIYYAETKFYVVGIIKEDGKEKYICYGVPAKYSANPPKELEGYCSFIPLSIFDMKGDGYWMMFQSAITGECLSLDKNKKI